jgi:hypothetical protein
MSTQSLRSFLVFISMLLAVSVAGANPAPSLAWHGSMEIAEGRGIRGPWQQNQSRYDFVDDPSVAVNDRGEIAVVWVDQASKDVFFQRLAADGKKQLAQSVNVSRNPATFSWLPRIIIAPDAPQKIFVLWQEIIFSGGSHGGDILFARSNDGGNTFSEPINLSNSIGGDGKGRINQETWHNGSFDLAAGGDGVLYATWTEYDGQLWFSHSTNAGRNFSPPRRVAGGSNTNPARAPSLALGPDRTIYLAWTVGEDSSADIRLAKSTDGGITFTELQIVAPSKNYSDAPKVAIDPSGVLHLVYAESSGGPFARYHVRYTRSADGARTFDAPRDISTPMPESIASAAFPGLSIDAKGTLYVIWEQYYDHRQRPRGLGITVSSDGGKSFTQPRVVPESIDPANGFNGSTQGLLMKKLAVNRAGAVAIVNSSLKQDERSRVWLIRAEMRH